MKIMDVPNSSKEPGGFWEAYPGSRRPRPWPWMNAQLLAGMSPHGAHSLRCHELDRGAPPDVHGGEQGTAGLFAILCELGERLCQFPAGKTFPRTVIWCKLSGGSSLGLLGMIERYQKRIEASRYLNI